MSDTDRVIKCIESAAAGMLCDEYLSTKSRIKSSRQVARICRELADEGRLTRRKAKCPLGDHTRVLNVLTSRPVARRARTRKAVVTPTSLSIEDAWRYIDRFCRAVWGKHLDDDLPQSLAEIITTLRDEQLLPAHEANMMHTIRALRNLVVHENLEFGEHETTIARAAWHIVQDWAEGCERDLWRLTMTMCGGRRNAA